MKKQNYVIFGLQGERLGMASQYVREILEYRPLTPVPLTPPFLVGVMNLRGKIVPVFDLWALLGLGVSLYRQSCHYLVIDLTQNQEIHTLAIIAEEVFDVCDISYESIEKPPEIAGKLHAKYLIGVAKDRERFTLLLSPEVCFPIEEIRLQIHNYVHNKKIKEAVYAPESTRNEP
ncbi:MAG: chemotaxis protein CheW [Leptospiraceae bacterium]|nr:chemotaxis protein CheW [Leptospiraceae bacterium]MDW8305796.1 chemotaxis protein CheW [Leptospiraceae bacterium]